MNTTNFSALCLLGLLSVTTTACTASSGDAGSNDDAITATGVLPVPAAPADITPGSFALSRTTETVDASVSLDLAALSNGAGTATIKIKLPGGGVVPAGVLPVGGIPTPPAPPRVYGITGTKSSCGKTYAGSSQNGANRVKIEDYRQGSEACKVAAEIVVDETVNGVETVWYGKVAPDGSIVPVDATKIVAHTGGGGFTPPPPAGSQCGIGAQDYQLDLVTKSLTWETCKFVDWSTPLTKVSGARVLTSAEVDTVLAAANAVKVTTQFSCGADKPLLTMTVSSPARSVTYTDDFYSCNGGAGPFVQNIDGIFGAFRAVVGE